MKYGNQFQVNLELWPAVGGALYYQVESMQCQMVEFVKQNHSQLMAIKQNQVKLQGIFIWVLTIGIMET